MASIAKRPHQRLSQKHRRALKQRQAQKARAARRQLQHLHARLPAPARRLLETFRGAFRLATYYRFVFLLCAALLTVGRHTVSNLLRTLGPLVPGHASSFHRVFCRRRWSSWCLARLLAGWVVRHLVPAGPIALAADDTVDEHRGKKVYGKGRHRDPVRSTHSYTAFRWGHKWLVVAVLVRFPWARRRWALPVLVALYRPEEVNRQQRRRHKTPPQLLRQLLRVLLRWFPDRQFVCAADGNFATHDLARLAARHRERLTFLSHFYAQASLYAPPPPPGTKGRGRPRVKGPKLPTPAQVVQQTKRRQRLNVAWYGGGRRDVDVVSGTGHWYQAGDGLVPVLWAWVHDVTGTHRDEYVFTTDVHLSPAALIEAYTGRWNIETTFAEMRAYLGLETTRGWAEPTVLRAAPCLFGLYTVVAALYHQRPARSQGKLAVRYAGKQDVAFADAITAVRQWLWREWVFATPGNRPAFAKLPRPFQSLLLAALAPAA